MGQPITVKSQIYRLRDLIGNVNRIESSLLVPGISPGKRQSLIKEKILALSKVKSLVKRIEDLANGNILTITFQDINTQERFRIIYTNLSQDDARVHLKMMAELNHRKIEILEIKEVQTKNSLTKL